MSSFAVREAKLRQAIADASSLAEQRRLTAQLDALRRKAADQVAIDRELELGAQIVRDTTTPVRVHDRHTAATDWLTDIEIPNGENYDKAMRVEAALWFKKLHTAVKSDRDEFAEQAQGMASRLAGQYGPKAAEAAQAFLQEVARLFRQADDRASDQAPDYDQSGNAESEVTDYDPEAGQDPMWSEDWDGEGDTGSQIGSGQESEQPGSATARRRYPKGSARGGGRTATRKTALQCSCAHNNDGSVTTMLCPLHADSDPCATMASVTGERRKGSIVNGVCSNCGWTDGERTAMRKAAGWSAGWNMPGYMPETEPEYFEDFESARDYIADELDRAADHVYDTDPNLADAYDSAIRDLKMTNQGPWSDLLPTSDSSYDLGISYWIDQSEDAQVWASRKRANEGKTCATCGDSIAQTDGDWHHDNGEKHDHKATPSSDKESRRKTAGVYCNTHDVWVGDGNEDTHEGCSKEQKATEKTKDARKQAGQAYIFDDPGGYHYCAVEQAQKTDRDDVSGLSTATKVVKGGGREVFVCEEHVPDAVNYIENGVQYWSKRKKAADDEATNEFAEEVAEELAGTSDESDESESVDNDDNGDVSSEDDDEADKEAKLAAFRKKVAESMPFGAPCPDEDCGLEEGHAGEHQDA